MVKAGVRSRRGDPCLGGPGLTRPTAVEDFESLKNVRTPPSSTVQEALQCFFLGGAGEWGAGLAFGPGLRLPSHPQVQDAELKNTAWDTQPLGADSLCFPGLSVHTGPLTQLL